MGQRRQPPDFPVQLNEGSRCFHAEPSPSRALGKVELTHFPSAVCSSYTTTIFFYSGIGIAYNFSLFATTAIHSSSIISSYIPQPHSNYPLPHSQSMPECMICLDGYTELKPLRHLKCNNHHYCEDCFCSALELAINKESNHPVPCGDTACPRLGYEKIQATLHRCTTITASRSNDLLQQYAHRLVEYNTTENRTYCSKDGCTEAHGNRRFLDVNTCQYGNGQRVQCPDCSTITCTECKQSVSPTDNTGHVCDPNASGMGRYVASLPDSERWRWRLCGRCVLWGEKADILSCNHITCEEGYVCL